MKKKKTSGFNDSPCSNWRKSLSDVDISKESSKFAEGLFESRLLFITVDWVERTRQLWENGRCSSLANLCTERRHLEVTIFSLSINLPVHNVFSVSKTSIKFKNMKFMIETRLKLTLYLKSVDYNLTLFPKNYPRELFYKRHNKLRPPVVICT